MVKAKPTPIADLRKGDWVCVDADGPAVMVWGATMVRAAWSDGRFIKWELRTGNAHYCAGRHDFTDRDAKVWKLP